MVALTTGSIGAFAAVQIATGVPFTIALVAWSVWYATRAFERSTEWDEVSGAIEGDQGADEPRASTDSSD
jgi:hypothetical protein